MVAHTKHLYTICVLGILLVASCGCSSPPWFPRRDDEGAAEAAETRVEATEAARFYATVEAKRAAERAEDDDNLASAEDQVRLTEEASLSDKEAPTSTTSWEEAAAHVGEMGTVCGPVAGTSYRPDVNGEPTFLNVGQDYPSTSRFTIVIWGEDRGNFPEAPEDAYRNAYVCVTGTIESFRGVAQMQVSSPERLTMQ